MIEYNTSCYGVYITGDRIIKSLKTICDNISNGCKWIGELRSLDKHLLCCYFTLLPCPNQCKKDGEILKLLRKDIEKHKKKECPRRRYQCPHCKETGEYQERTTTHLQKCPNIEIPCPNSGCSERVQRCKIQQHQHKCLFEILPCKYTTLGCKKMTLRKDLEDHEENSQLHLQLAIDTVDEMKDQIAKLKSLSATKIRFTYFNYHKLLGDAVYFPPFYSSPTGYCLCIGVHANGNGKGEGTHVSVFAFLMRGENDDHLPWPFTGRVTVELLNQLEDKNHHSIQIAFSLSNDNDSSQRVTNEERSPMGLGYPCYIPHADLGYDKVKHRQYLKDDCLYFRVSTETDTPWLV